METPLLTAIICSISPDSLRQTADSLRSTAGIPVEVLSLDNRELKWGICKVYNHLARKASADNLLFIHEDVRFVKDGWGQMIVDKLNDADSRCGVVGLCGSTLKSRAYSGWPQSNKASEVASFYYIDDEAGISFASVGDLSAPFCRVVTVDGLAMFVKKSVWSDHQFDERLIDGFHGYDLDFSLQLNAAGLSNFVACGGLAVHHSNGHMNASWVKSILKLHDEKWQGYLPVSCAEFSRSELNENEAHNDWNFLLRVVHCESISKSRKLKILVRFLSKCMRDHAYQQILGNVVKCIIHNKLRQ